MSALRCPAGASRGLFGEGEVQDNFPEVPAEWLRVERWTPRVVGPWHYADGIVHLEARPLVTGLQRVAESAFGKNVCQFVVGGSYDCCSRLSGIEVKMTVYSASSADSAHTAWRGTSVQASDGYPQS